MTVGARDRCAQPAGLFFGQPPGSPIDAWSHPVAHGAALAAYRLVQELRVDTGVLEIALIATVAQLVGAEAGYFRLRGGDVLAVILLAFQVVFWVILGPRVFFFDVLPWHGGFGLPAHDLNVVLLVALVAAALGLVLLYRAAFRTLLPLRRTPTSQAD